MTATPMPAKTFFMSIVRLETASATPLKLESLRLGRRRQGIRFHNQIWRLITQKPSEKRKQRSTRSWSPFYSREMTLQGRVSPVGASILSWRLRVLALLSPAVKYEGAANKTNP